MKILLLISFFLWFYCDLFAQETKNIRELTKEEIMQMSTEDLLDVPLEDLMFLANKLGISIDDFLEMKTGISSKKELNPRESPSILTIITEEQIKASGARDLLDVLSLVPGYTFGRDVDAVVGVINRGNWANEGKVLLLIDGQEMNEIFYGTLQFGGHYNINNIKKIEIIRGAGSSIYGGYAELGVINIITKQGKDYKGAEITARYGQMKTLSSKKTIDFQAGNKINDLDFYISGTYTQGNNSEGYVTNFNDTTYHLSDGYSKFTTQTINAGMSYKGLKTKFLYDNYQPSTIDYAYPVTPKFRTVSESASYDIALTEKLKLTPTLSLHWCKPWELQNVDSGNVYKKEAMRSKAQIDLQYDFNDKINLSGGTQFYYDHAKTFGQDTFYNGKNTIGFTNSSVYAQALLKTKWINLVLGARDDYHSQGGNAFSPRIAITKIWNNFHYKILYSKAFRSPSIDNYNYNQNISPEKTTVIELETGYRLSQYMFVTANFFDITIKKPIVYYYDSNLNESFYENFEQAGSRGVEMEYIFRNHIVDARINYSYYTASSKNKVELYKVYDTNGNLLDDKYVAAPTHKVVLYTNFNINNLFTICPTLIFYGEKYAYTSTTTSDTGELTSIMTKVNPFCLFNCNISYKVIKNFTLSLAAYNILDKKYGYAQAYNGDVCPYPAPSREFILTLRYDIKVN